MTLELVLLLLVLSLSALTAPDDSEELVGGGAVAALDVAAVVAPDVVAATLELVLTVLELVCVLAALEDADELADEDVVVPLTVAVVTPHTDWPMIRLPLSVGPSKYSSTAFTVRVVPDIVCSLKT